MKPNKRETNLKIYFYILVRSRKEKKKKNKNLYFCEFFLSQNRSCTRCCCLEKVDALFLFVKK